MNDNSKIIKNHKNNYLLEAQVFIGGENIDQLYLYPPTIRWNQKDQQQTGGGKKKKNCLGLCFADLENKIDKLQTQKDEICDQYGNKAAESIVIQEKIYVDNMDKDQSTSSSESEEVISNSEYSDGKELLDIKNQVLDNVMSKLDQSENKQIKKRQTKKKKMKERFRGIDGSPDVQFASIPINFNDVIKGGKTIHQEEQQPQTKNKKKNKYLYPNEARLKNLSYESKLTANIDVKYTYYQIKKTKDTQERIFLHSETQPFKDVQLCKLPIMLKSCLCVLKDKDDDFLRYVGECPYDQGGYFIVQGQEKVIIAQERSALNKLFVEVLKESDQNYRCKGQIRSTSQQDSFFPKTVYFKQYKNDKKRRNAIFIQMRFEGGAINAKELDIPIYVMFRALNIENDKDIENIITPQGEQSVLDVLYYCKQDSQDVYDQEQAFEYIKKQIPKLTKEGVQLGLVENLFPNLETSFYNKAMFLGKVIQKFIKTSIGEIQPTDRDSMYIKRIDTGGQLYENMIRDIFNQFRDVGKSQFDKLLTIARSLPYEKLILQLNSNNFQTTYPKNLIQENIDAQMRGKYGQLVYRDSGTKKRVIMKQARDGVIQDLSRTSYLLYIDMQNKVINHQNQEDITVLGPHLLHCSQFGYFCPSNTPDGRKIGIHKYLTVLAKVSQDISSKGAIEMCKDLGIIYMQDCTQKQLNSNINIYVNSMFYGVYDGQMNINQLLYYLLLIKRNGLINITTSISCNYQSNEINILSDSGRAIRPLIILKNNEHSFNQTTIKKLNSKEITWQDLIYGAAYQLIDNFDPKKKIGESYYYSPKDVFKTDEIQKIVKQMEQCQCAIEYLDHEMSENALIAVDEQKLQENEARLPKFMDNKLKTRRLGDLRSVVPPKEWSQKLSFGSQGAMKGTVEDDYYFYTHLEIDPSVMLSAVQNHGPFLNHNPSNRNLLFCQQGKHSVGLPYTNFNNRLDTQCYILNNPQRSLCSSVYQKYYNTNSLGFGFNACIVVMSYTGQNQEDAVLFNKGSVERGMFDTTCFKSFSEVEEKNERDKISISFQKDNTIKEYVDKTDENGLPKVGSILTDEQDIILSKIKRIVDTSDLKKDIVVTQKNTVGPASGLRPINQTVNESFVNKKVKNKYLGFTIDKVFVFLNQTGVNEVKVRLQQNRKMQLGDKVGSRQAQKGVAGGFINPEDMPYSQDGEVPDLIITPTAFPTRQTIAYFLEACMGKIGLRNGTFMDSTAFHDDKDIVKNIAQIFTEMGLHSRCQKIFYNGFTGDQIRGEIFHAPMFYMKLKQMAVDKINARGGEGPLDQDTRTPVEGRSQGGAPKIGNMEVDALQAHGIQSFMKESLLNKSNLFILQLCNDCGRLAQYKGVCSHCNGTHIRGLDTSYSFKQFTQELNQMHIKCTFDVEGNEGYYN